MRPNRTVTVLLAMTLVAAAVVPAAVSAAPTMQTDVEQDPNTGEATVTVTRNGTVVENATVEVTSESSYPGTGNYTTDANGTVELPEPNETVRVNLTVIADGQTSTNSVELLPREASLGVSVAQADDGTATVTVTQYGEFVENATVEVSADGNYSGEGTYLTNENGTVELQRPEETRNVTVTATYDGLSAETTAQLAGDGDLEVGVAQGGSGVFVEVTENGTAVENATVEVSADGNYSGEGTYLTNENGTVELPLPTENVTVAVTATFEGEEATTTATLSAEFTEEAKNFGQAVERFIESLRAAGFNGPLGRIVSEFVTTNNPSNDVHDGEHPSADAPGRSDADDVATGDDTERERNGAEDEARGPPEHAKDRGNRGDHSDGESGGDADEDDEGGRRGPPEHARN
jgi:hypothetical protein